MTSSTCPGPPVRLAAGHKRRGGGGPLASGQLPIFGTPFTHIWCAPADFKIILPNGQAPHNGSRGPPAARPIRRSTMDDVISPCLSLSDSARKTAGALERNDARVMVLRFHHQISSKRFARTLPIRGVVTREPYVRAACGISRNYIRTSSRLPLASGQITVPAPLQPAYKRPAERGFRQIICTQ